MAEGARQPTLAFGVGAEHPPGWREPRPIARQTRAGGARHNAHVILAGRRASMTAGQNTSPNRRSRTMVQSGRAIVKNADVNVLGLTFKGIVPDLRKSKVIDVITNCVAAWRARARPRRMPRRRTMEHYGVNYALGKNAGRQRHCCCGGSCGWLDATRKLCWLSPNLMAGCRCEVHG